MDWAYMYSTDLAARIWLHDFQSWILSSPHIKLKFKLKFVPVLISKS